MKNKQLGYILDGMEFLSTELLQKIEAKREKCYNFGIGVFSDSCFEVVYGKKPLKPYKERAHLASFIKGVDFVWEVKSFDNTDIENIPALNDKPKPYHVVYAPGTYDLLHEGHLEHLLECRALGDILVVGVKSDTNVFETKHKYTQQSEAERISIIRGLNFIDHAFLVTTHDKHWANEQVLKLVGEPINAVVLGSDCLGQEEYDNPDNLLFLFTKRDPIIAKTRSSSYYRRILHSDD